MDWEIQSWKSQLWRWSPSGLCSFGQEWADCGFYEETYWTRSTCHHSWNSWKMLCFNRHNWKKMCMIILIWEECSKMDTPSSNRPAKETERVFFSLRNRELNVRWTCWNSLNQMGPNAYATLSQVIKPGCTVRAPLTSGPVRCEWLLMERDELCFGQVSRVGSNHFPFFFNTQVPVVVDILQLKSTLTATY